MPAAPTSVFSSIPGLKKLCLIYDFIAPSMEADGAQNFG